MIRLAVRFSVVGFALLLATAGWLAPLLEAQGPLQPAPGEEALLGGLGDKLLPKESSRLGDLRFGKRPVVDAVAKETQENQEVLKKAARYYAYRLTNPMYLEKEKNAEGITINDLVKQAGDVLLLPDFRGRRPLKTEQLTYLKEFTKELVPCLREVLTKNAKPIVRINAARILAGIAETGQEEVADTFVDLIKNPKEHDAVKLYAFRGLKEIFELGPPDKSVFQKADREAECIKAAVQFVARPRPPSLPADAAADEVAGYQYVRREALRMLAETRYPVVSKVSGPEGLTALWMWRALKKQLDVETSLAEQAEAAVGLAKFQYKLHKDYNLDFAAFEIGGFLLDFIKHYNDQRVSKVTTIPWRLYTARLLLAIDALNTQARDSGNRPAAEFVARFNAEVQKALKPLELDKDANPNDLDEFLRANADKLPNKELIKGVKEAILKTGKP